MITSSFQLTVISYFKVLLYARCKSWVGLTFVEKQILTQPIIIHQYAQPKAYKIIIIFLKKIHLIATTLKASSI